MRTVIRSIAVAAALCSGIRAEAAAQTTIVVPADILTWTCSNSSISYIAFCGQSFTTPTVDNVLQSFTLTLRTTNDLMFEIYSAGGVLAGPALFSQTVAPTSDGEFIAQTFTPVGGLTLTPGVQYLALMQIQSGERVTLRANSGDAYADGKFVTCSTRVDGLCRNPGQYAATHDAAFDARFTSAPHITPEPETIFLLGTGLLTVGGLSVLRRRRLS